MPESAAAATGASSGSGTGLSGAAPSTMALVTATRRRTPIGRARRRDRLHRAHGALAALRVVQRGLEVGRRRQMDDGVGPAQLLGDGRARSRRRAAR